MYIYSFKFGSLDPFFSMSNFSMKISRFPIKFQIFKISFHAVSCDAERHEDISTFVGSNLY